MNSYSGQTKTYLVVLGYIALALGFFSFIGWILCPQVDRHSEQVNYAPYFLNTCIILVWAALFIFFPFSKFEATSEKIEKFNDWLNQF